MYKVRLSYKIGLRAIALALVFGILVYVSPATADDDPGAKSPVVTQLDKVSDPVLLALVGKWEGTCKMGHQSGAGPAEVTWETALNDRWVEGTVHAWNDLEKKSMFFDARMYIRPTATPGTYKAYCIDNSGAGQTGTIVVKDGVWHWNFAYDNGNKETGTMDDPGQGKVMYKGMVVDPAGQEIMYVGLNLSKVETPYSGE